jgi:D-ribulokinase
VSDYYLGLDFGTSGARSCLIDATSQVVHQGRIAYADPDRQQPADWRRALLDLLARLPQDAKSSLSAIAIDGTSGTALLAEDTGTPVGPALLYFDSCAVLEAREIDTRVGLHTAATPTSGLTKFLWLLKQPGSEQAKHACHQADWLAGQLTGDFAVTDYHNALKSGYDLEALAWPDWMESLPIASLLPAVFTPGEAISRIKPEMARRIGLNADCLVRAGTTDSIAAFIATEAAQPGDAVTSLGTTLVLKLLSEVRVDAPEYGVYSHKYGDIWLAGGASNTGGGVLKRYFDDGELAKLSAAIDPDQPSGLDYYPLRGAGERFPVNDPALAPRLTPRPGSDVQFLHGLLEGMARIEAQGYRKLEELGATRLISVLTAGGGATNESWRRIRQRYLGTPVSVARHGEASYGAARLARFGTDTLRHAGR